MCGLLILLFVPSLIALSFGAWTGPVLGIPALAFTGMLFVFRATPGEIRFRTKAISWDIPAPPWSGVLRGIAVALDIGAVIWASYIGLSA